MGILTMNKHVFSSILKYVIILFVFLLLVYFFSGFSLVEQNEIGIKFTFGKVTNANVEPGIVYSLPYPFGELVKIPEKVLHRIFIDDFTANISNNINAYQFYDLTGLSTYLVTADNNILNAEMNLQYRITNAYDYYFSVNDNEKLLREYASQALIKSTANVPIDLALTTGKRDIEIFVREKVQYKLDKINAGINILVIELINITPPSRVQTYFDDVINASIEINRLINDANSYRTQQITNAQAEVNRRINDAEMYKTEVINASIGEKNRFLSILSAYQQNPGLEKSRLFIEFVKNTFESVENKIYIQQKDGKKPANIRYFH